MPTSVVGLFDSLDASHNAISALMNTGFKSEDISIISPEADAYTANDRMKQVGDTPRDDVTSSTVEGTLLGGVLGLLVGTGLLLIPGIGPVLAAGPLAVAVGTVSAAIGATAVGAASGGLIGYLVGEGLSTKTASYYAEGVRRGGRLVSVRATGNDIERARQIMQQNGAVNIDERAADWRSSGWSESRSTTDPVTPQVNPLIHDDSSGTSTVSGMNPSGVSSGIDTKRDFRSFDEDFRNHFQSRYGLSGTTYDNYMPAYRYGYEMANDSLYWNRDWASVESELQHDWGTYNYGKWEQFKDSIHYAWDRVRNSLS